MKLADFVLCFELICAGFRESDFCGVSCLRGCLPNQHPDPTRTVLQHKFLCGLAIPLGHQSNERSAKERPITKVEMDWDTDEDEKAGQGTDLDGEVTTYRWCDEPNAIKASQEIHRHIGAHWHAA